jgi:FAD/FMN-containing dehydrogenase
VRAEAGATFVAIEAAARRTGQELAMLPTTTGSTIGGFLAGGAGGVGSIEHGWLWDGFAHALEIIGCPPAEDPVTVTGADCRPYLHAYGVSGIIAVATVALAPARTRVAVLASYPAAEPAVAAALALVRHEPPPRLVSLDEPGLVATYPPDDAMPPGRHSLRTIVDSDDAAAVRELIEAHGGRVEAVRPNGTAYLSSLAFNHVTLRARRARPELCHLQASGEALLTRGDEIRSALPGALLHLDGLRLFADAQAPGRGRHFGGLLLAPFPGVGPLYTAVERLTGLGVHIVDPHTWLLDGPALPAIRTAAAAHDPAGLLNPGKLPGNRFPAADGRPAP